MLITGTATCTIAELCSLSNHDSAEEAMEAFCSIYFKQNRYANPENLAGSGKGFYANNPRSGIPALIMFTGVVKSVCWDADEVMYGPNFATYINKNRLGTVVQSPVRVNRIYHPDRSSCVWIWAPNVKGLEKWWKL